MSRARIPEPGTDLVAGQKVGQPFADLARAMMEAGAKPDAVEAAVIQLRAEVYDVVDYDVDMLSSVRVIMVPGADLAEVISDARKLADWSAGVACAAAGCGEDHRLARAAEILAAISASYLSIAAMAVTVGECHV